MVNNDWLVSWLNPFKAGDSLTAGWRVDVVYKNDAWSTMVVE